MFQSVSILSLIIISARFVNAAEILNISIVAVDYIAPFGFSSLVYVGPPLSAAAEYVQWKYRQTMNFQLTILYDKIHTGFADLIDNSEYMLSEWHYRQRKESDLTVYIVVSCANPTDLPYFNTQWNTLLINTMSECPQIRDRQLYPTWISVNTFSQTYCSELYIELLTKYNWTSTFFVIDSASDPYYPNLANFLLGDLNKVEGTQQTVIRIATTGSPFGEFGPILERARRVSRVVLFFGHADYLREFMISAALMNMTNGEYVYIATESMHNKVFGLLHWQHNDSNDQIAFQAYQSMFIIHPRGIDKPPDHNLGPKFVMRSKAEYSFTYDLSDQAFFTLADNYGSITALAQVLNESLTHGEPLEHGGGTTLAKRFLNRTFADDSGAGTMYINKDGQRRSDFTVSYYNPNGTREPLMHKIGMTGELLEVVKLTTWGLSPFPPPNEPFCGYMHQNIQCQPQRTDQLLHTVLPALAGILVIIGIFSLYYVRYIKRKAEERLLLAPWWHVTLTKISSSSLYSSAPSVFSGIIRTRRRTADSANFRHNVVIELTEDTGISFGIYQNKRVVLVKLCNRIAPITFEELSGHSQFLHLMRMFYRTEHPNSARFLGLAITGTDVCTVSAVLECPSRGTFLDIWKSFITQDEGLTSSLITDFLDGMQNVHSSAFGYHGRLSIMACWIDKHFTLKIANLATDRITSELCRTIENLNEYPVSSLERLYWTTPETPHASDPKAMQAVDIFSSGLIIYEVLSKGALYKRLCSVQNDVLAGYDPKAVLQNIEFTNLNQFEPVLRSCWNRDPTKRPSIVRLRAYLSNISPVFSSDSSRTNMFDNVYKRLSDYSIDLEREVAVRSASLRDEMEKCDAITAQFLPRAIIKQMRAGRTVDAEFFDSVSIMFMDLSGFADFVKSNPPESTIRLIGVTEACFDLLSLKHDVYKVEAAGDSYLVASGLPVRNGENHIKEIATFAIKLMEAESTLPFLKDLRFKTGINSGPCAGGVLGLRRPRYCLFGDTVNTASRMCSHGIPGRIHLSSSSIALLDRFPEFAVEPRGIVAIKGKSAMMTYWLTGLQTL